MRTFEEVVREACDGDGGRCLSALASGQAVVAEIVAMLRERAAEDVEVELEDCEEALLEAANAIEKWAGVKP